MLTHFVELFLEYIDRERNFSPHTSVSYTKDLDQFQLFLQTQFPEALQHPENIDQDIVRSFLSLLLDSGMARKSVVRKISALRSFFKFAVRRKLLVGNPMSNVVTPKAEKKLPQFLDERTVEEMMNIPDAETTLGARDAAILELLYSTGMRRGELVGLREGDIDFYERTVKVVGKGNKQRIIPFGKKAQRALEHYKYHRKELSGADAVREQRLFSLRQKANDCTPARLIQLSRNILKRSLK